MNNQKTSIDIIMPAFEDGKMRTVADLSKETTIGYEIDQIPGIELKLHDSEREPINISEAGMNYINENRKRRTILKNQLVESQR